MIYAAGCQKFELPLAEVSVDGVFRRMEEVKLRWAAVRGGAEGRWGVLGGGGGR